MGRCTKPVLLTFSRVPVSVYEADAQAFSFPMTVCSRDCFEAPEPNSPARPYRHHGNVHDAPSLIPLAPEPVRGALNANFQGHPYPCAEQTFRKQNPQKIKALMEQNSSRAGSSRVPAHSSTRAQETMNCYIFTGHSHRDSVQ